MVRSEKAFHLPSIWIHLDQGQLGGVWSCVAVNLRAETRLFLKTCSCDSSPGRLQVANELVNDIVCYC